MKYLVGLEGEGKFDEYTLLKEHDEALGKHIYKFKGIMLQAEIENRNGRKYPLHVIEREVKKYNEEKIKRRGSYGTFDHDPDPNIHADRISHIITELYMDGKNAIGTAEIIEELPMGRLAKVFVEKKMLCGMSSRGVGELNENIVADNYNLLSIDFVITPSAPHAYMEGVLESKEYIIGKNGLYIESAIETLKKQADTKSNKYEHSDTSKIVLDYILQFIESIGNKKLK